MSSSQRMRFSPVMVRWIVPMGIFSKTVIVCSSPVPMAVATICHCLFVYVVKAISEPSGAVMWKGE